MLPLLGRAAAPVLVLLRFLALEPTAAEEVKGERLKVNEDDYMYMNVQST